MQTIQILLIEDNPGDVRLMQEFLKEDSRFTYEIQSVKRLAEGMDYQTKNKADIILLDLSLPDSQGFDTFTRLNACAPTTPIVILTGLDDDALAIKAVQSGAQDYLIKGQINGDILTRAIRYSIQRKQAENDLLASTESKSTILQTAMDGFSLADKQGRLLEVNEAYCRMSGYSEQELLAMRISDLEPAEVAGDAAAHMQKIMVQGEGRFETRHRRKDGTNFDISVSVRYRPEEGGRLVTFIQDITARKQAETTFRKENEFRNLITQTSPVGITMVDRDGVIRYANSRAEQILGLTKGKLAKMKYNAPQFQISAINGEPFPEEQLPFVRVRSTLKPVEGIQHAIIYPNKKRILLSINATPLLNEKGLFNGMVASLEDITERKQTEKEIESLARFPSENPNPTLRIAKDGTLVFANPSGKKLLPDWHLVEGQAVPPILQEAVTRSIKEGKTQLIDIEHGGRVYSFSIAPIVASAYANAYGRDITESKKAEEEIRRRVTQLATARAIGKTLNETLELDQIYDQLYQAAMSMLPDSETMFISLFDREKAEFRCVFGMGEGERIDTRILLPALLEPPGKGTQSEVVHTCLPLIVNNLQERLKAVSLEVDVGKTGEKPQSGLYVPMIAKDEVIGVMITQSRKLNRYTDDDAEMLSLVANTAAIAIQNAQLFTQTEQRLEQISAMHTIDTTISNSFNLELTLNIFLEITTSQLGVHAADILVLNKNTQYLECTSRHGFRTSALQYTKVTLGQGLAGQVALERKIMVIQDLSEESMRTINSPELASEGFATYIGVPLIAKGEIIGVLELFHREKLELIPEQLNFLETLAGQAALAIDNSMLFNNSQRSTLELTLAYDATLQGWANALDLRDKETQDHSKRVIEMTMQLAGRMGYDAEGQIQIRRGAMLHDIGKMGVPDGILHKPGPLTEEEWVSMRMHPQLAYELLEPINYLHKALEIPYCHHEKWDGTGYPRGLKGEQIPLSARIFAVIDVWDALISDRPYRKAWTEKKALSYIKENSGLHFDARVVKEFLELDTIKNSLKK